MWTSTFMKLKDPKQNQPKKIVSRNIIVKFSKFKDKKKNLKAVKEKETHHIQEKHH